MPPTPTPSHPLPTHRQGRRPARRPARRASSHRSRPGQGLLEYAIAAAALFLAAAAAAALVGAKVGSLLGLSLAAAPGAHPTDNPGLTAGPIIELTDPTTGAPIAPNLDEILNNTGTNRLDQNFGNADGSLDELVLPPAFESTGSP